MSFEARVATSNTVRSRNNTGQFISRLEAASLQTMEDVASQGVALSRSMAPQGHRTDPRTVSLQQGFFKHVTPTSAYWGNRARHALPQETGSRPHPITGDVSFFWEKRWRMWTPGTNTIRHPGNPARPFLRPAYEQVMSRFMEIARKHYGRI